MLIMQSYKEQVARWPRTGRHLLAHYTTESIVVYQAYRPSIAQWAIEHQEFGGPEFSFSRMSWVKPSFLWMMFRSNWGRKVGQQSVLAVHLLQDGFNQILAATSGVRVQWDPDHDPSGKPVFRRTIQLGLRAKMLQRYAKDWIVQIEDISELVATQREKSLSELETPREEIYPVQDKDVVNKLGIDPLPVNRL